MDCGHESFRDAKVIIGDLGWRTKQLIMQEALPAILSGSSCFSWFTLTTIMVHQQKRQRGGPFRPPPFKWVPS